MKAAFAVTASILALTAAVPAFAGSLAEPVVEPAPVAPMAPIAPASLWGGFYAGAQVGGVFTDKPSDQDEWLGGVHLGWQGVSNKIVYGIEGDYNYADVKFSGDKMDNLSHIKAKLGYDLGKSLIYVTAGGAYANVDHVGDEWGWAAGAGYDYMIAPNVSLGAEVLYNDFDSFGTFKGDTSKSDLTATTVEAKVAYHF